MSNGELAYFACSGDNALEIPRWRIDGNVYHHNELPADHWFNQTGLIVFADTSKDGWNYRCILDQYSNGEKSILISNPVTLTVTEGET